MKKEKDMKTLIKDMKTLAQEKEAIVEHAHEVRFSSKSSHFDRM